MLLLFRLLNRETSRVNWLVRLLPFQLMSDRSWFYRSLALIP